MDESLARTPTLRRALPAPSPRTKLDWIVLQLRRNFFLTDVEISTAGLMVSVTIWMGAVSAKTFGLPQSAQADECDVVVESEIGRYRREICLEPSLVFETRAK